MELLLEVLRDFYQEKLIGDFQKCLLGKLREIIWQLGKQFIKFSLIWFFTWAYMRHSLTDLTFEFWCSHSPFRHEWDNKWEIVGNWKYIHFIVSCISYLGIGS